MFLIFSNFLLILARFFVLKILQEFFSRSINQGKWGGGLLNGILLYWFAAMSLVLTSILHQLFLFATSET